MCNRYLLRTGRMSVVRAVPWALPHMRGALGVRLPDVRNLTPTSITLSNTWASLAVSDLGSAYNSNNRSSNNSAASRGLFELKKRDDVVDRVAEIDGSLNKRVIKARIRFLDYSHNFKNITITAKAKETRRKFNMAGGAFRFVYNKALEYIKTRPSADRGRLFNLSFLSKTFLTVKPHQTTSTATSTTNNNINLNLIARFPWLKNIDSRVLQQALKSMVEAYKAGLAKKKRGGELHYKKRCNPSAWTFIVPAICIKAEHVERPTTNNNDNSSSSKRIWTKLTLPCSLGGNNVGNRNPAYFGGVVHLTQKMDIVDGRLLADVKFSRDRLGHWHAHCQRASLKNPKIKQAEKRTTGFFDPGSRTGNTIYMPDAGQVAEIMAGVGGINRIFELCLKIDKIITKQKALSPHSQNFKHLKRREHYLRLKVFNMVRDGHIRAAAYIWSRVDTAIIPLFDTHKIARKPLGPNDPRRKISAKTVRKLFSLRHGAFRDRLRHSADTMGKEYVNESEEYTTKGCPSCLTCTEIGGKEIFTCCNCGYTALRDVKSGLMLAIKCLKL